MKKLIAAFVLALCCLLLTPALASAATPSLKSLAKAVRTLQKTVKGQKATIAKLKTQIAQARQDIGTVNANPVLTLSWLPTYLSLDTNAEKGVAGPNIVFQGANVHVRSSTSETDTTGLGNLIVGWNDNPTTLPTGYRSGSNNLTVGFGNCYSSYGCFVGGSYNTVSGPTSAALGDRNTANAEGATVTGGQINLANKPYASVSGGTINVANGAASSVSGGVFVTQSYDLGWATSGYEHH